MFCFKCGSNIADNSKFCPICGNQLSAPQSQPSTGNVSDNVYSQSVYTDNVYAQSTMNTNNVYAQSNVNTTTVEPSVKNSNTVDRNISVQEFHDKYLDNPAKTNIRVNFIILLIILGVNLVTSIVMTCMGLSYPYLIPAFCVALPIAIIAFTKKNLPCSIILFVFAPFALVLAIANLASGSIPSFGGALFLALWLIRTARGIVGLHKQYKRFKNGQEFKRS